jgi:hypothetical protein
MSTQRDRAHVLAASTAMLVLVTFASGLVASGGIVAAAGTPFSAEDRLARIGCAAKWKTADLSDWRLQLDAIAEGCRDDEPRPQVPSVDAAPASASNACAATWLTELGRFFAVTPVAIAQLCDARADAVDREH